LRLKGKVALVTGGATGIGEQIVRAFVREGAATAFMDLKEEAGRALAAELSAAGRCAFVHGNIANENDCAAVVAAAEKLGGPVSILVNNAAIFVFKSYDATAADWRASLEVNVMGTALATRAAVDSLKRAGGGAIVNLGSISAFIAQPRTMTYNTTKAAIVEMTRCLALDLAPYRIRVNSVCPGYILTPAFVSYVEQNGGSVEQAERDLADQIILKRLGKPEEIAQCAVFLASDEASYVTGTALVADGGLLAL
jgi:NAD(P)-dependent dehydrogenase (short-subunit alcohol dehydrogenase family)